MNDVLATVLALGLIYLVLRFAFGGPSSSSEGTRRDPIPLHEQHQQHQNAQHSTQASSSGIFSSGKKETLISRYGLESRLKDFPGVSDDAAAAAGTTTTVKGKGRAQTDEEWKKGADQRKDDLKRRREDMILEARRKLLEKQQNRAAVNDV